MWSSVGFMLEDVQMVGTGGGELWVGLVVSPRYGEDGWAFSRGRRWDKVKHYPTVRSEMRASEG